jgi:hypothetical protein
MIQIEETQMYKSYLVEKHFRKKIRNLTTALITVLCINPHGRELVEVCGLGSESDNTEAIYGWVKNEVCCASCVKEFSFAALQRRFVRFLLDHSRQQEYVE